MKLVNQNSTEQEILEDECRALWENISLKIHQPNKFDICEHELAVNYSPKPGLPMFVRKDFSIFLNEEYSFFESITIKLQHTSISVTPIELAKLMFLLLAQDQKPSSAYVTSVFNGVCLFFALMKDKSSCAHLVESDYEDYYGMIFSLSPTIDGLVTRLAAPSFPCAQGSLNLSEAIKLYRSLEVPFEFDNLSEAAEAKLINKVCLNVMGFTYNDYRMGESFNYLGLEVGRHYIDHCANVFEGSYAFAIALRNIRTRIPAVLKDSRLADHENFNSTVVGRTLTGAGIDTILDCTSLKRSTVEESYNLILDEFRKLYNDSSVIIAVGNFEVVEHIIKNSNLPERFDTYEFVRSFLMAEFINNWNKSGEAIFEEYAASLKEDNYFTDKKGVFDCCFADFLGVCRKAIKMYTTILPKRNSQLSGYIRKQFADASFVGSTLIGINAVERYCYCVESAGAVLFAGLTGWRRSEFGFTMDNVRVEVNTEILDNLYTPWRFNVNWVVPKTYGDAMIDREITSYAYLVAYMAAQLNLSGNENPALYRPLLKKNSEEVIKFRSSKYLSSRVDILWLDFVENYTLFNSRDALEATRLSEIKSELLQAGPIYEFYQSQNKSKALVSYQNGSLNEKATQILDSNLSDETKEFLRDKDNVITSLTAKSVSKELISGLPYPTPHAFRHVWAEAVLTRYRGNIGKVLRANFKHMDKRFFMAYLRDKEMSVIYRIAQRTVINQVVRGYVHAANDEYHDYTGGFHQYVARATRLTKVVTPEEREKLVEKINANVISIEVNGWSSCILRMQNQHKAKCSEDGVPQRRNAAPEFCLGCMHADISEMNYTGIVISIKDDVLACRSESLPLFVKEPHVKVLKLALSRLKDLRKNSGSSIYDKYIDYLEESIVMAAESTVRERLVNGKR